MSVFNRRLKVAINYCDEDDGRGKYEISDLLALLSEQVAALDYDVVPIGQGFPIEIEGVVVGSWEVDLHHVGAVASVHAIGSSHQRKRIAAIKALRNAGIAGLKEAKDFIDSVDDWSSALLPHVVHPDRFDRLREDLLGTGYTLVVE